MSSDAYPSSDEGRTSASCRGEVEPEPELVSSQSADLTARIQARTVELVAQKLADMEVAKVVAQQQQAPPVPGTSSTFQGAGIPAPSVRRPQPGFMVGGGVSGGMAGAETRRARENYQTRAWRRRAERAERNERVERQFAGSRYGDRLVPGCDAVSVNWVPSSWVSPSCVGFMPAVTYADGTMAPLCRRPYDFECTRTALPYRCMVPPVCQPAPWVDTVTYTDTEVAPVCSSRGCVMTETPRVTTCGPLGCSTVRGFPSLFPGPA